MRLIGRSRPDFVHVEYPCLPYGRRLLPVILPLILRSFGIKTVVRAHEFSAAHVLRRMAIAFIVLSATKVLLPSHRDVAAIRRLMPWAARRVGWLPNTTSVPVRPITAAERARLRDRSFPGATVVACYFGYLSRTKDVPVLVEAVGELLRMVPHAYFVVIGGGNVWPGWSLELNNLRNNAAIASRIRWTEHLTLAEISEYLQVCDLALLPFMDSVDDRRTSFLAALAHGLATVSTGRAGDQKRYPAALVPPGDSVAFLGATLELATDSEKRAGLARAARSWLDEQSMALPSRYEAALADL
jgi:glycosyltransferase involved in cell wall biosynthesis